MLTLGPGPTRCSRYMECRFISLAFSGVAPSDFSVGAWKTHYPYDPSDSQFSSSNATLNAVFELCRYTLEAASLDTYTDSNTRERRPCVLGRSEDGPRVARGWSEGSPSAVLGWH